MDSTAKFPDIHFAISLRRIIQISCKTSGSRDNFLHFEHISEQLTVFSFSRHFLTVNTVVYVHRDNEPVQGRIWKGLKPLKKHLHVIGTKNLVRHFWRWNCCSLHKNLILVLKFKWCRQKMYRNLDQMVQEHFLFLCTVCMPAYKVAGPIKKPLASAPSNGAVIFHDEGFSAKLRCRFATTYRPNFSSLLFF